MKTAVLGAGKMGQTVIGHLIQVLGRDQSLAFAIAPERSSDNEASFGVAATCEPQAILAERHGTLVFFTSPN